MLVRYRLIRESDRRLALRRELVRGATPAATEGKRLDRSLVGYIGGIRSGRISSPPVAASEEDLRIDQVLGPAGDPPAPTGEQWRILLPHLRQLPPGALTCEGGEAAIDLQVRRDRIVISDAPGGSGYLLHFGSGGTPAPGDALASAAATLDRFANGIGIEHRTDEAGKGRATLVLVEEVFLTRDERSWLLGSGGKPALIPLSETEKLVSRILPGLRARFDLDIRTERLPERLEGAKAGVLFKLVDEKSSGALAVTPLLIYIDSGRPVATVEGGGGLDLVDRRRIPRRRDEDEHRLARWLQSEFNMAPLSLQRFQGSQAIRVRERLAEWVKRGAPVSGPGTILLDDAGAGSFQLLTDQKLIPQIRLEESGFLDLHFAFAAPGGTTASSASGATGGKLSWDAALAAFRSGDPVVRIQLENGLEGYAKLPIEWIAANLGRVQELLSRLKAEGGKAALQLEGPAGIHLPEALELALELGAQLPGRLQQLSERLGDHEKIPEVVLPSDLTAELRHYQKHGVSWLRFLGDAGLGACLADDMGLGKTLQALCALEGRTLIVAPTSVLVAWREQTARFRPSLRLNVYHGTARKLDRNSDITLTTYGILRQDAALLTPEKWDTVILDEAQVIKNPDSKIAQTAWSIQGRRRITLSGTPIENRLDELWSQMNFLNPGLLPAERREFQEAWESPILVGNSRKLQHLRRKIRPFLLRRLKKEVAPELPERTDTVLHCELDPEEQTLYQSLLATARKEVVASLEEGQSTLDALERILRLRQACCHRALLPGESARGSSKLDVLLDTLRESIDGGHRVLVFSQWTSLLDIVSSELSNSKIGFTRLDGSTRDRQAVVEEFQSPSGPPVMLLSLKAGGTGLTLTAADHVIILDPWWNPAVEDQAADRAHRIGQSNPVLIQRIVARDTIEERILELQLRKRELARQVLDPRGGGAPDDFEQLGALSLTRQDLLGLLA
jgi:superfamily II DNA or RNA helicase